MQVRTSLQQHHRTCWVAKKLLPSPSEGRDDATLAARFVDTLFFNLGSFCSGDALAPVDAPRVPRDGVAEPPRAGEPRFSTGDSVPAATPCR